MTDAKVGQQACHPRCGCMLRAPPSQVIAGLLEVSNGLPPQCGCMQLRPLTVWRLELPTARCQAGAERTEDFVGS
jgi:hypothetical protein